MAIVESDPDNIYIKFQFEDKETKVATNVLNLDVTRVDNIINTPSLYEFNIYRYFLNASNIPLAFFSDDWEVTLRHQGVSFTTGLIFTPSGTTETYAPNLSYFEIQTFIDDLNTAFKTSFDALKLAFPGATQTEAPFFTINPEGNLYVSNVEQTYATDPNPIEIYFNADTAILFESLQLRRQHTGGGDPSLEYLLEVKDNKNNSGIYNGKPFYITLSEYSMFDRLSPATGIRVYSYNIPVREQLRDTAKDAGRRLLGDYLLDPTEKLNRKDITFTARGPLRWIDLNSVFELRRTDIEVRWVDRTGRSYPIPQPRSATSYLSLAFRKKKYMRETDTVELL